MTNTLEISPDNLLECWLAALAAELGKLDKVNRHTLMPHMAAINAVMGYEWEISLIVDPYFTETRVQYDYLPVRTAIASALQGRRANLVPREEKLILVPQGIRDAAKLLVDALPAVNQSRRGAMLSALANRAKNGSLPAVERFMVMAGLTQEHAVAIVAVTNDLKAKIREAVKGE